MNKFIKQAFTLIELLVVIAIIGILSGLIVISMGGVTQKATIAKAQVFSNSLRNSLMLNLISDWKFDENTGTTTADTWNNTNSGSIVGGPAWKTGSDCVAGSCIYFDGVVGKYIDTNLVFSAPSYITTEFWVNNSATADWQAFLSAGQTVLSGSYLLFRRSATDQLEYRYSNGTTSNLAVVKATYFTGYDNKWTLVTIAADYVNNIVYFYRNGELLSPGVSMTTPVKPTTTYTRIGAYTSTQYSVFGYLDEIRIYDAVIPTSQIKEHYYIGLNSLLSNGNINKEEYKQMLTNSLANK